MFKSCKYLVISVHCKPTIIHQNLNVAFLKNLVSLPFILFMTDVGLVMLVIILHIIKHIKFD